MKPIWKNILAVLAGLVVGNIINFGIIMLGITIIPLPEGVNISDPESMKTMISSFETKHYIFPLLAHALGTLVGAYLAARMAANRKMLMAIIIGIWFLIGGITNAIMIGSPWLPTAIDLVFAYLPMALIGGRLGIGNRNMDNSAI